MVTNYEKMAYVCSDKLYGIPGEVMDLTTLQKLDKPTWSVFRYKAFLEEWARECPHSNN